MKQFLAGYLFIGMMMTGIALGRGIPECPHESSTKVGAIAEAVVVWPVFFAAALTLPKNFKFPPTSCEAQP